jgi:hypothetical protein
MTDEKIHVGQIIRLIIDNQNRSLTTNKKEIKQKHKIDPKKYIEVIEEVDSRLREMGMMLVGVEKDSIVGFIRAEKYFIVKEYGTNEINKKRKRMSGDVKVDVRGDWFTRLLILLTLMYLEGGCVYLRRLIHLLRKIEILGDEKEIMDYINDIKSKGYVRTYRCEDECYVKLSWRFYSDFPNFDPSFIFKGIIEETVER